MLPGFQEGGSREARMPTLRRKRRAEDGAPGEIAHKNAGVVAACNSSLRPHGDIPVAM